MDYELNLYGGSIKLQQLSKSLYRGDIKAFKVLQVYIWVELLNEGIIPIKWYAPNEDGTLMDFTYINNIEEFKKAKERLKDHISRLQNEDIYFLANF